MAVIIFIPSGLQTPELEIMLSKAQACIEAGKKTIVATCSGGQGYACSLNIYGLKSICKVCRSQTQRGLKSLKGVYQHIETPSQTGKLSSLNLSGFLTNRWSLKKYSFERVDVGQAAYSSYIALSRDQDLEGRLAKWSLRKLLATSETLVVWSRMTISKYKIKEAILYNGRQNQYRPLLRVAQQNNLVIEVMEFSGQHSGCVYVFKNQLPQDLDVLNEAIQACWLKFMAEAEQCARNYYSYKRSGGVINDSKAYVIGQKKGMLPPGWDFKKHNIAIFNSSEDEFAALGGEYDKTLYKNQTEAITKICESLCNDPNIFIWLRIHPNLKDVKWEFAARLQKLKYKYKNLHVIPGNSPVSSYSLLDACSTAVSFGSTMGIEAAYWGKPSILLGRCIYERLGSVYTPSSHDEVLKLLQKRDLQPLPLEGTYKVALFWSKGGHSLPLFTGDRSKGFRFSGEIFSKNLKESSTYAVGKFLEKIILGDFINFGLRQKKSWWEAK